MNKQDIEKYLRMVGLELEKQGITSEMLLLGGAVMLIEVGCSSRLATGALPMISIPTFYPTSHPLLKRRRLSRSAKAWMIAG